MRKKDAEENLVQRNAGVKLVPREVIAENHPGHMGLMWRTGITKTYRGFRFYLEDLPEEVRPASQWRAHLFENRVPGYVFNDVIIRDAEERFSNEILGLEWVAEEAHTERLEIEGATGRYGWYSFSPDQFEDCNNCVTWAIDTVNKVFGEILPRVPNGRIKLAIEMLKMRGALPSSE